MIDFINVEQAYKQIFLPFPIALLYNKNYRDLSDSAKIAYIILTDRFRYSIQNNWLDENNNVYFIYTNDELKELLNCGKDKVIKIKKELENKKLLFQVQQGQNQPNRLYLGNLQVNANEVYIPKENSFETLDNKGSLKNRLPQNDTETLDNKGSLKNRLPQNDTETLDNKGSLKNRHNLDINNLDTYKDTYKDTGSNSIDLEAFTQQLESETENEQSYSIPEKAKQTLLTYALNNYKILEEQIGIIFRAKSDVTKQTGKHLVIENFTQDFNNAISNVSIAIYKDKKNIHKIKNYDNYFYGSMKNYFLEQVNKENQLNAETSETIVPMTNYLEN